MRDGGSVALPTMGTIFIVCVVIVIVQYVTKVDLGPIIYLAWIGVIAGIAGFVLSALFDSGGGGR